MTHHSTPATKLNGEGSAPSVSASRFQQLWTAQDLAPLPACLLASVLCLTIAVIHIQDQGGFLGNVTPEWMAIGYYLVESVAAVTALLFARQHTAAWILGLAVSAGPATAYILSRSVGLPGDSSDIGNWGYLLGTVSLIVEGTLFTLCAIIVVRTLTGQRPRDEHRQAALATTS